jgi:hypothetical protein
MGDELDVSVDGAGPGQSSDGWFSDVTNNVWGTLSNAAGLYKTLTQSTPSGKDPNYAGNPPPGSFGYNPQANAKPTVGGMPTTVSSLLSNPTALLIAAGVLLLLLFGRAFR